MEVSLDELLGLDMSTYRALGACLLAAVFLAFGLMAFPSLANAGSASARGHKSSKKHRGKKSMLPKGTPYGAEVIATITGDANLHHTEDATTYNVCEEEAAKSDQDAKFDFQWKVRYPQVTVPVATGAQLGKAIKRLSLKSQPTSKGTGGLWNSSYAIKGHDPLTSGGNQGAGGSDCQLAPYSGGGGFHGTRPSFYALKSSVAAKNGLFIFNLGLIDQADPPSYQDGETSRDPITDLGVAEALMPSGGSLSAASLHKLVTYNSLAADFKISELKKLVNSKSVTLPPIKWAGTNNCSEGDDGTIAETCSVDWNYTYHVKLTKRFLYKTKKAYRK